MMRWLQETRQLDLSHPKLRITALKLTQSHQRLATRAAAIHDFVRRMPFEADSRHDKLLASSVLLRGSGDCQSKGLLFTALCRAAGLPARMLFVDVKARFLAGVLRSTPDTVMHAVGQVHIDGRWLSTDGYVVDPVMFALAKQALRESDMDSGWGIVEEASGRWNGDTSCIQQFREDDVVRVAGAFSDIDEFRAATRDGASRISAVRYAAAAAWVNWRVGRFRQTRRLAYEGAAGRAA